jgi:hypothetical protein
MIRAEPIGFAQPYSLLSSPDKAEETKIDDAGSHEVKLDDTTVAEIIGGGELNTDTSQPELTVRMT